MNVGSTKHVLQQIHKVKISPMLRSPIVQKKTAFLDMSRLMGKQTICIGENKDADQLCGNLCFRYSDSTIPLLSKSKISSL